MSLLLTETPLAEKIMRIALFALFALTPFVHAAEIDCKNATIQMDMNICAGQDFKRSDALLNQAYKQKMAQLSPEQQTKFKAAQRSWIAFRDNDCAFMSSGVDGGSVQPMIYSGCLQQKTEQRTKEINDILHCEEGDLSCP
jgi:uncharacterized protein YecT (DUF1311 family)